MLRGTRPGVGAQQLAVRLGLQLAPGREPRRVERARSMAAATAQPGSLRCAQSRNRQPAASSSTSAYAVVHAVRVVVQREFPHPRGVDEQAAAGQQVQLARRGGVPAAAVGLPDRPRVRRPAGRPARWPGWTCRRRTGRPSPRSARRRAAPGAPSTPAPVTALTASTSTPSAVLGDLLDRGRHVGAEVGLGENDHRRGPAAPGDGEVALDPAQPGRPGQRVHNQHQVEVRRHDLRRRRPPRRRCARTPSGGAAPRRRARRGPRPSRRPPGRPADRAASAAAGAPAARRRRSARSAGRGPPAPRGPARCRPAAPTTRSPAQPRLRDSSQG